MNSGQVLRDGEHTDATPGRVVEVRGGREVTYRMELASELLEKRGYGDELKKLLKRGHE